ncbi:MAG: PqiC family protein [Puniceicoccales bacterium]|jgi:uncharacterized lipoprotein YmbA|nr:PqiC family protein [Puniceicoccales bacterium]
MSNEKTKITPMGRTCLLVAVLLLAGCAASPPKADTTRYYVLNPAASKVLKRADEFLPGVTLHVEANIRLPSYFPQKEILVRQTSQQLAVCENERWAEDLTGAARRVFRVDMAQHLGMNPSEWLPKPDQNKSRRPAPIKSSASKGSRYLKVGVDIIQFDGSIDGEVTLRASWSLMYVESKEKDNNNSFSRTPSTYASSARQGEVKVKVANTGATGFDGYVAAMSQALDGLAGLVAQDIRKMNLPQNNLSPNAGAAGASTKRNP